MRISAYAISFLASAAVTASAFHAPSQSYHVHQPTVNNRYESTTKLYSTKERSPTVSQLSQQMREMQSQIGENEDADLIMQALRGRNINDDDAQVQGLEMRLIEFDDVDGVGGLSENSVDGDRLPLEYDAIALQKFFKKRPQLIASRIAQVTGTGGKVIFSFIMDALTGKLKDPDSEVKRAAELRDTITSLGPFFIKLGQVSRYTA